MSGFSCQVEVLIAPHQNRTIAGPALSLLEPISFWGGVSPTDGKITDPSSSHCGVCLKDKVLLIRALRGSSSGSSVLLELAYKNLAPAAIILAEPDAILALGALVGREMGWVAPALIRMSADLQARFKDDSWVSIDAAGHVAAGDRP
jgi:predicted aconitase with swiveling domain